MAAMSETLTAIALAPMSRSVAVDRRKWTPSSKVSVVKRSVSPPQATAAASSPMPTRMSGPGGGSRPRSRAMSPRSPSSDSVVREGPGSGSSPALTAGSAQATASKRFLICALGTAPMT